MRYWPDPSVVAVRTFSMSAGLAASTVTPGSPAPDASLTTPEIEAPLCAPAVAAVSSTSSAAPRLLIDRLIGNPPSIPRRHNLRSSRSRVQYNLRLACIQNWYRLRAMDFRHLRAFIAVARSEERRVGKECR